MMIKKFKRSYFVKNLDLLKKNLDNVFMIFIFDVWFLAVLLFLSRLANLFGRNTFTQPLEAYSSAPLFAFFIIYFLLVVFIYSIFKYIVLHYLKRMFAGIKLDFKRLGSFFVQNLIIVLSYFIIFFVLNGIFLLNAKRQAAPFVFLLVMLPFVFFAYSFLNIMHTLSINSTKIKEIFAKALKITFTKIGSYAGICLSSIIILLIYFFAFFLVGTAISKSPSSAYFYQSYFNAFTIITSIVLYIIIFFNRPYFYLIIKDKFLKKD